MESSKKTAVGRALSIMLEILLKYSAPIFLVLLIIASSIVSPHFLTTRNIFNVMLQQVPYLLISLGVMLTIMTAGIDLSVAATAGCGGVIASLIIAGYGQTNVAWLFIAVGSAVVLGCIFGIVNGLLVSKLRMAPFIITLAMMSVGQGVAYLMTGGSQIQLKSDVAAAKALTWFAAARDSLGVPVAVYVAAVVVLIFWFIMRFTSFGRLVLAVGSNEAAVRLAGINVAKYKMMVYTISSALAALAGVFIAGRTALGAPAISKDDYALTAVAACVIGGVALEGGKGTVAFTVCGVFILALITNIMNLAGFASYPQLVAKGVIIVLAISLNRLGESKV